MIEANPKQALLVVDVQNDFCPGGTLAVAHGDEVLELLNRQIADSLELSAPAYVFGIRQRQNTSLPMAAYGPLSKNNDSASLISKTISAV